MKKHEAKRNIGAKEDWQVDDKEALRCVPESGWITDLVDYITDCTDAPVWFALGTAFSVLSAAAGAHDVQIQRKDGKYGTKGLQMWVACVGRSGTRKSQPSKIGVRILAQANPDRIMPKDGSTEGIHDALAMDVREGIGLWFRDELTGLFDGISRNYSKTLYSWLLETYEGDMVSRTHAVRRGEEEDENHGARYRIDRPRLSLLGNIPPKTLQQKTDSSYWQSGFLTRFTFWAARRTRYIDFETSDAAIEDKLSRWLTRVALASVDNGVKLTIPYEVARPFFHWVRLNVEDKDQILPEEVISALNRLQHKGFQMAALIALSRRDKAPRGGLVVTEEDMEYAMRITKLMYDSFLSFFAEVAGTTAGDQFDQIVRYIENNPQCTRTDINTYLRDIPPPTLAKYLQQLVSEGQLNTQKAHNKGKGRPTLLYSINTEF